MGDYEVFHAECNMLEVQESKSEEQYPEGYTEYMEGMATLIKGTYVVF